MPVMGKSYLKSYYRNRFTALFQDYQGEPVPEGICCWISWCKGRYHRQTQRQYGWSPLHPH